MTEHGASTSTSTSHRGTDDHDGPAGPFALLLPLTAAAACADAFSYLGLGRVFTANMTGNTVLLCLDGAEGRGSDALRSALALIGFAVGVAAATFLLRRIGRRIRPHDLVPMIALECVPLAALAIVWAVLGRHVESWSDWALIGATGLAMGMQSAAVRSLPGAGVATTFITGTWTDLVSGFLGIADRRRASLWRLRAFTILTYAAAAIAGGALVLFVADWTAPILSIALLVTGAFVARRDPALSRGVH